MMLATRYGVTPDDHVPAGLANALHDVVLAHIPKMDDNGDTIWPHSPPEIMRAAAQLGLYAKTPRPRHVPVTLTPPPELRALITKHQNNLAVRIFFEDALEAVEAEAGWIQERLARRREASASEAAPEAIDRFEKRYGTTGLDALRRELENRMWW
jgi:hypothetical protein